ncbi:hypothetical protein BZA05DRAFT_454291 [Tricharina praecox]|uniref:uncharacterized protein n=1 Tax=Tricharina praecox TaxID=43433 RepID=UPI0022211F60|nr:uncharacterized protein BZA05DRAFT_454291 [Tricharina praecox]KAI5850017.1 hypothetical protein BZA05DRAFT_454291 [Tricharina praecox]
MDFSEVPLCTNSLPGSSLFRGDAGMDDTTDMWASAWESPFVPQEAIWMDDTTAMSASAWEPPFVSQEAIGNDAEPSECRLCLEEELLDSVYFPTLNPGFQSDVYDIRQRTFILSLQQLKNLWSQDSLHFRLHTPIESISMIPLVALRITPHYLQVSDDSAKVLVVRTQACGPEKFHSPPHVFKSIECSITGWKLMYHELRQLLCMPPHPNIIRPPAALVYSTDGEVPMWDTAGRICDSEERIPIVGFLTPVISGQPLSEVFPGRQSCISINLLAKWCRQLTNALLHILHHGNGPNRPGFYSDLKPNNVLITSPWLGEDVVLMDFESTGNWKSYSPGEVLNPTIPYETGFVPCCCECLKLGMVPELYRHLLDEDDDIYQPRTRVTHFSPMVSTPPVAALAHLNNCPAYWQLSFTNPANRNNTSKHRYSNPPYGYCPPWINMSPKDWEKMMVYSLGLIGIGLCRRKKSLLRSEIDPCCPPGEVPWELWSTLIEMVDHDPVKRPSLKMASLIFGAWEREVAGASLYVYA